MKKLSSFVEMRFPIDISCGSVGGPAYFTNVVSMYTGREQRNINWTNARRRYNVSYGVKNAIQFEELVAFFHNCRGKAIGFRFKDWSDYVGENQIIGIGDGISKKFQLCKNYESYLLNGQVIRYCRNINKPVFGTVRLYICDEDEDCPNDAPELSVESSFSMVDDSDSCMSGIARSEQRIGSGTDMNLDAVIDYSNGTICFFDPPAVGTKIIASFEFDVPVRFDSDYLPTTLEGLGLNGVNDIQIVEIKVN